MRKYIFAVGFLIGVWLLIPVDAQAATAQTYVTPHYCYYSPYPTWIDECMGVEDHTKETQKTSQDRWSFRSSLPSKAPDPTLSELPFWYARVTRKNAPLFTSLEAAIAGQPVYRTMETGFNYITYIDLVRVEGKRYFMISPGIWLPGDGVSPVATPKFQSLEFTQTPKNDFG
jgi:hypothetical protein